MLKPRVLLIHANPFQQVMPVPPYGLERLRTAVEDLADVRILDPYLVADDPLARTASEIGAFCPDLIGLGIRVVEDCVVIDSLEGPAATDVYSFLPEIRALRDQVAECAPALPMIVGGAAFSYFPHELLELLAIEHGVVGAGEQVMRRVVERLAAGEDWRSAPGLTHRGGRGAPPAPAMTFIDLTRREPLYGPSLGIPIRTRIGCAMQCTYCLTASLGRRHAVDESEAVLAELERVVLEVEKRGAWAEIFFADDEFNLPESGHALRILEGAVEHGLAGRFVWRAYFNPTPFDDELARMIKATGGHVSLTTDSASDAVLAKNGKPFRRRHLDSTVELLIKHQISADLGFIFGLPGETGETLRDSLDFIRQLPPQIGVYYSSGARVYPHTPLAELALADPGGLPEGAVIGLEPVAYSRPWPPRELARFLAAELAGYDNVCLVGAGFARATRFQGLGLRALSGEAESVRIVDWAKAIDAARGGGYHQQPSEALESLIALALWHGRPDLAALATKAMLALPRSERNRSWLSLRVALFRQRLGGRSVLSVAESR